MPCYYPLTAWQNPVIKDGVSRPLHFAKVEGYREVQVPCGQCIGCRLDRSRMWAVRCMFEASLNKENCWITLTYDNEHLPYDQSLDKKVIKLFIKRLRSRICGNSNISQRNKKIKYYLCGEYGEKLNRPHYHICLFGYDFKDKYLWSISNGLRYYRSNELETLWTNGHSLIGELNFETAAYTARYCTKKITGLRQKDFYKGKEPEFSFMSLRPAIAKEWFKKYKNDLLSEDVVYVRNGIKCRVPRYFDKLVAEWDEILYNIIKERRIEKKVIVSYAQLKVKEKVKKNLFKKNERRFEND